MGIINAAIFLGNPLPCSLPLLKSLDISFNQINALPEEIGLATALVK